MGGGGGEEFNGGGGSLKQPHGFFGPKFLPLTNCQTLLHNSSSIMKTSFDTN